MHENSPSQTLEEVLPNTNAALGVDTLNAGADDFLSGSKVTLDDSPL